MDSGMRCKPGQVKNRGSITTAYRRCSITISTWALGTRGGGRAEAWLPCEVPRRCNLIYHHVGRDGTVRENISSLQPCCCLPM